VFPPIIHVHDAAPAPLAVFGLRPCAELGPLLYVTAIVQLDAAVVVVLAVAIELRDTGEVTARVTKFVGAGRVVAGGGVGETVGAAVGVMVGAMVGAMVGRTVGATVSEDGTVDVTAGATVAGSGSPACLVSADAAQLANRTHRSTTPATRPGRPDLIPAGVSSSCGAWS